MKKRMVALILGLAMVMTSLAACGNDSQKESVPASEEKKSESKTEKTEESSKSDEVVELTWFNGFSYSNLEDGAWFEKYLAEEVGVKLNIAAGNGDETVFDVLIASGEMPDIIGVRGYAQFQTMVDSGLAINLDDYKDQLPNLYNAEGYDVALENFRNTYGGVYLAPTQVGDRLSTSYAPRIRWDLYKELGYPQPETAMDLLPILKQMQEMEPETADGSKVYALSGYSDWDGAFWLGMCQGEWGPHTGWGGFGAGSMIPVDASQEPVGRLDEGSPWLDMLEFYFEANQMGILDPDTATQGRDMFTEKVNNGIVLYDPLGWANNEENGQVIFPYYRLEVQPGQPYGASWAWAISKDCENLDKALEFLNWFYSDEASIIIVNGPEGAAWEWDANGEYRVATQAFIDAGADRSTFEVEGGGTISNVKSFFSTFKHADSNTYPGTKQALDLMKYDPNFNPNKVYTELQLEYQNLYGAVDQRDYVMKNPEMSIVNQFSAWSSYQPLTPEKDLQTVSEISTVVLPLLWQAVYAADKTEFDALIEQARELANELGYQEVIANDKAMYKEFIDALKADGIEWALELP